VSLVNKKVNNQFEAAEDRGLSAGTGTLAICAGGWGNLSFIGYRSRFSL